MTPKQCFERPQSVEWKISPGLVPYPDAVAAMEHRAAAISDGRSGELVWLLEHPPIYTAGTSAVATDLIAPDRFPVFATGRGGPFTYHGPGQRIAYVMLDLKARGGDVRAFVGNLESWIIATLTEFGVTGVVRKGRIGVWVERETAGGAVTEAKIAALGIRVRRGVTYHGVSINVAPNLEHFSGIVPCGLGGYGVTSLKELGIDARMAAVDTALKRCFAARFG